MIDATTQKPTEPSKPRPHDRPGENPPPIAMPPPAQDDLKRTAEHWLDMAVYDFRMLGLDTDRQEVPFESLEPSIQAYVRLGRDLVRRAGAGHYADAAEALRDALTLQRVCVPFLPPDLLKLRTECMRKRFLALVGNDDCQSLLACRPADKPATIDELRAELDFILSEFLYVYLVTPLRYQARGRLLRYCMRPFLAISTLLVLFGGFVAWHEGRPDRFATLALVPIFGSLGAMISMQQRLESMPNKGDTMRYCIALDSGHTTLWTTSIAGSVFAVIINLVFLAGMIEGDLFPSFDHLHGIHQNLPGVKPLSDIALMLIWSFISGFAERLVPDTITKLTQILRSEDFRGDRRAPGRPDDPDAPARPDAGSLPDDIYSRFLKAQSEMMALRESRKSARHDADGPATTPAETNDEARAEHEKAS